MAVDVIYSHRDESGDRLRVECWMETIGVDAEDAHDGDRVSVHLSREEGLKLARALLAALDAEPEEAVGSVRHADKTETGDTP